MIWKEVLHFKSDKLIIPIVVYLEKYVFPVENIRKTSIFELYQYVPAHVHISLHMDKPLDF